MTPNERRLLIACAKAISADPGMPMRNRQLVRQALAPFVTHDVAEALPAPAPAEFEPAPTAVPAIAPVPAAPPLTNVAAGVADDPRYALAGTAAFDRSMPITEQESLTAVDGRLVPSRTLR